MVVIWRLYGVIFRLALL